MQKRERRSPSIPIAHLIIAAYFFRHVSQAQAFQFLSGEAMFQGLVQALADMYGVIVVVTLEDHLAAFETNDFAAHDGFSLAIADTERIEPRFRTQAGRTAIVAVVKERFAGPLAVRR